MTTLWNQWVRLTSRKEDPFPLALFRIAVGLTIIHDLLSVLSHGALPLIWVTLKSSPEAFKSISGGWLITSLGGASLTVIQTLSCITLVSATMLVAGVFSRLSAFITLQLCIALFDLNLMAGGGHDRLITNALWLLVLSPASQTLSIPTRLKTGKWLDKTPVSAWPKYLIILQLVVMYTTTGLQKLGAEWFPWGSLLAVHNMLLTPQWARYDLSGIAGWISPFTMLATATTWLWETTFWMVLLPSRTIRFVYIALGAMFHIGLWLLADLGPFSEISLALYPCLFTAPELYRLLHIHHPTTGTEVDSP